MITFDNSNEIYTEGLVQDSLKAAANIDVQKIKDDWDDSQNVLDYGKAINNDILAPAASAIDKASNAMKNHRVDNRSLIARSRNSVMQFPVYMTHTIRVNEAHIIAKLFERVYASLFQSVLSQNPIIEDESKINDLIFLRKFHTNINESAYFEIINEYYQPVDTIDEILKESVFYREQITPTMEMVCQFVPCTDERLINECARLSHEPLEGLTYLKEDSNAGSKVEMQEELEVLGNAALKKVAEGAYKGVGKPWPSDPSEQAAAVEELKQQIRDGRVRNYKYMDGKYYHNTNPKKIVTKTTTGNSIAPARIRAVDSPKLLRDADIKKINGMLPYTIEASFIIKPKGEKELEREVHFIIGIKTTLHLISPQDLAEDLREIVTGKIKKLQKVRYKTGEIKWSEYMFNKKGIKKDAAKSVNYNKKWINTLKRLAEWEKTNGTIFKNSASALTNSKVPIPNGTIVLTQSDVTTMINQTGIDLSIVSNAKRMARSLFLIAVCIVDSSAGTMRVLFPDSDSDWDTQSLAAVDSELSKTDNSALMKELNRMVNH